jgi:hypothetical protein
MIYGLARRRLPIFTGCLAGILVMCSGLGWGQDTIRLKTGITLVAEIIEVSPADILYRNWKEDKPLYRKPLSEIDYIRYANGRLERFGAVETAVPETSPAPQEIWVEETPEEPLDYGRFFLGYNLMDVFFPLFTTAFEYLWPDNRIGLMVPLSIGLAPWNFPALSHSFFMGYNPLFRIGLEPRFYAARAKRISYVISPAVQYMRVNFLVDYSADGSGFGSAIFDNTNIFRLMLYNGFTVVSRKRVVFGMDLGVGYQVATGFRQTATLPLNRPAFQLRMFLGRRF